MGDGFHSYIAKHQLHPFTAEFLSWADPWGSSKRSRRICASKGSGGRWGQAGGLQGVGAVPAISPEGSLKARCSHAQLRGALHPPRKHAEHQL